MSNSVRRWPQLPHEHSLFCSSIGIPACDITRLVFKLLFTKPGLPTLDDPVDEDLLQAFFVIAGDSRRDVIHHTLFEDAVSTFGLTLISNRFKKFFVHAESSRANDIATIIAYVGPLFRRFCAIRDLARQFQEDGIHVHVIRKIWKVVDASDGLPLALREVFIEGLELIIQ